MTHDPDSPSPPGPATSRAPLDARTPRRPAPRRLARSMRAATRMLILPVALWAAAAQLTGVESNPTNLITGVVTTALAWGLLTAAHWLLSPPP